MKKIGLLAIAGIITLCSFTKGDHKDCKNCKQKVCTHSCMKQCDKSASDKK
jgi:hypothetical protein